MNASGSAANVLQHSAEQPFAILSFVICHLPFAICHLPFAICHLHRNDSGSARLQKLQKCCKCTKQCNLSPLGNEIYCNAKISHCSVFQHGVYHRGLYSSALAKSILNTNTFCMDSEKTVLESVLKRSVRMHLLSWL